MATSTLTAAPQAELAAEELPQPTPSTPAREKCSAQCTPEKTSVEKSMQLGGRSSLVRPRSLFALEATEAAGEAPASGQKKRRVSDTSNAHCQASPTDQLQMQNGPEADVLLPLPTPLLHHPLSVSPGTVTYKDFPVFSRLGANLMDSMDAFVQASPSWPPAESWRIIEPCAGMSTASAAAAVSIKCTIDSKVDSLHWTHIVGPHAFQLSHWGMQMRCLHPSYISILGYIVS